ncbi:MAG: hypothetical protein SGI92_27245 [Bryobacteraceae bacterium]|nr:hypothetical protein [Bryobacteraceae bacterium]
MRQLFLSYRFRPDDEPWAARFKRLVDSHCLSCVTGEDLGAEPILTEVTRRISQSDALVALFLNPYKSDDFHKWIFREYTDALRGGKRVVAVVQDGFPWVNLEDKEYVKFDPADPVPAFLKLSKIIGDWRHQAGRTVLIRLSPPLAARDAYMPGATCRYRLRRRFEVVKDWALAKPDRLDGTGVGFAVHGVPDDVQIEIQVTGGNTGSTYISVVNPELLAVELTKDELA